MWALSASMLFQDTEAEKFEEFLELLRKKKLREVKKYSKDMVIWQKEFAAMIYLCQSGQFSHKHEIHYWEHQPEHLQLNEEEEDAFRNNGLGPLEGKAQNAVRKISQMFVERKWVVGHLFYTPDLNDWHMFYFDLNDLAEMNNHWTGGKHAHYISHLWPQYKLPDSWEKFCSNSKDFGGSVHIKFKSKSGKALNKNQNEMDGSAEPPI